MEISTAISLLTSMKEKIITNISSLIDWILTTVLFRMTLLVTERTLNIFNVVMIGFRVVISMVIIGGMTRRGAVVAGSGVSGAVRGV